jgi:uncharacterized membrane protein YfcA
MILIIYSWIIFIATLLGSLAGLGGGIIIKPMLDFVGFHAVMIISFISTVAVFSMSLYAIIRRIHTDNKLPWKLVIFSAIGALLGGYLGDYAFTDLLTLLSNSLLRALQAIVLILLLLFVLVQMKKPSKKEIFRMLYIKTSCDSHNDWF